MAKVVHSGFNRILALLQQRTGVDFAEYKEPTLRRRIERRMKARKIHTLDEYSRYLRSNPPEIHQLFQDVLIQVTSFFRDPLVFKTLKAGYLSQLTRGHRSAGPIRIWVPACSTGEEVYSLAMILAELQNGRENPREVHIFGTDVNEAHLDKARAGIYPNAIRKDVSAERLRRFFEPVKDGFRVGKLIRDFCIFARHNLASDPPFCNLDLISCRNALIYMTPTLQAKIMPTFHFALKSTGCLLLGTSESVGTSSELFLSQEKKSSLYRKKAGLPKEIPGAFLPASSSVCEAAQPGPQKAPTPFPARLSPSELRAAVDKIIAENSTRIEDLRVGPITIPNTNESVYLVFVEPQRAKSDQKETGVQASSPNRAGEVARLRRELLSMRKSLETVIEQKEAANEELRAANEEVISSNEELQSTNEELETAHEELQASNEELATLNGELENRNTELERANVIASHFKAIVDSSDDAIISKDLNGIIQSWNNAAQRLFGYTAEEVIGKPVTVLFPPELVAEEPVILAKLRAGQHIDHYETVRRHKDGRLIDISLSVSPIEDSAGHIIGASKIARDITDKKRAELEIRRARDDAERASHAKDAFLAALSHELRTPLNPILLVASDAAADQELSPGIRANFDLIRRNIELEARLIDDLLDLARVGAGKLKVENHRVNIHAVLAAAIAVVQSEIEQKKITLTQELADSQSAIFGDIVRLQQVFLNVLKNAVKFTPPEGKITVESRAMGGEYVVQVSDTGIGMSERELAHVFDAFKQGDHSEDARRFGGLGLGLTISKNLVALLSGTIEASSKGRGRGSTFTLKFPLAEPLNQAEKPVPPSAPKSEKHIPPLRILLVEDHEPTRIALARLLINRRHRVAMAESAGEAIALSKKNKFDMIISDIGLPDGNGYDLFKTIVKQSPQAKGIALTGYGMDKDLAHSKDSGFFTHLTKPVRIEDLETALSEVTRLE